MRLLLLALLSFASVFAADMCHVHVLHIGGSEVTGWWDPITRVLYLPNGSCQLVDQTGVKITPWPAPADFPKPQRRTFAKVVAPYGRVKAGDQTYVGWYYEPRGMAYNADGSSSVSWGPGTVTSFEPLPAPGPMPASVEKWLTHMAIEYPPKASEPAADAAQKP